MHKGFFGSLSESSEDNKINSPRRSNSTHHITLECDYAVMRHYWGEMYTCVVRNLDVPHSFDYILNVTGDHMSGKSERDVRAVFVLGQRTPFIPYNITSPFGGVTALRVEGSGLRFINRTMVYEGNLQYLHLENNLIEEVPKFSLRNQTELLWISFRNNRIRYLESGLLHGMTKLWRFSASNNRIEVIPTGLFHDTPAIREIYFYNNRIRMVGWRMVNWMPSLKIAAFYGNGCTDISIYDGVDIRDKLSKEFQTKCSVDCRHAEISQKRYETELEREYKGYQRCGGHVQQPRDVSSDSSSQE